MDVKSYYRTIDWYNISEDTRYAIHQYLRPNKMYTPEGWKKEYDAEIESHRDGWYIHFHTREGFTRFVLTWM
jgi:hypothetical protein